jgi:hypothetical protein
MTTREHNLIRGALVAVIGMLLLIVSLPSLSLAAPSALPTRPTRWPTATPTATPPAPALFKPQVGAYIELHVHFAHVPREVWTRVQWQDYFGAWHDVDGWQGTLDAGHQKLWWVADEDLGTGPFRWVVYQEQAGPSLAASEPFYLPDVSGKKVIVDVTLGP